MASKRRKGKEIAAILLRKFEFEYVGGKKHDKYKLEIEGIPPITVVFSRNNKIVSSSLHKILSQELHVRTDYFQEMLDCTKSRDNYYEKVRNDPFPPFPPYMKGSS